MRLPLALMALLLLTAGCIPVTQRPDVPVNSLVGDSANLIPTLVADASTQLALLYPPVSTPLRLAAPPADTFGQGLATALTAAGYQLTTGADRPAAGVYTLSYIIDVPAGQEVYRVTVSVGGASISRAYLAAPTGAVPAGPWSQRQ